MLCINFNDIRQKKNYDKRYSALFISILVLTEYLVIRYEMHPFSAFVYDICLVLNVSALIGMIVYRYIKYKLKKRV